MVLVRTICAHMLFLQGTCSACDLVVVFSKSDKLTYLVFQVLHFTAFLMSWQHLPGFSRLHVKMCSIMLMRTTIYKYKNRNYTCFSNNLVKMKLQICSM